MQSQGNPSSAAPNPNQNAGVNPTPGLIPPFFPGLIPGMVPPPFPMPMMPGAPGLPAMQAPFPFVPGVPLPPGFPGIGMIPPFTGLPRPPLSGSTSISAPPITAVPVLTTPAAPAQVLVGNPVLRGPTSVASVVAQSSANNINLFNNINTNSCFINATSDLLNKHIFANAMAGLPLTIFVGHVPYDMEDSKLAKMFESCGKVTKFIRPVDPISTLPTTFAFITYAQAICALRAVNILNDFVVNKDDDWKIFVKLGSKEAPIIKSIKETEDEAAASLPPGFSLDDVYNPIKASIEAIVRPKEANEDGTIVDENIESGEIPSSSALANGAESLEDTNGYYKYLNREAGEVSTEDDIGEKFLYSEIEKFRLRQLARDKKLEEQRRQKVKERLIALEAAKKQQAEDQAKQKESGAKESKPGDNAVGDVAQKRKSEVVDYEEMEAKKRRKLQVLQMLSGEVQEAVAVEEEKRPSGPIKVTAALTKKTTKPTGKAISAVATMDEEDEYEKKRELIRLDYTEEELKSFDDHARRRFDDEEEDDEGKGSAKSKAGASLTKDREEKTSSTSQPASTASQQQSKVLSNEVLKKIAEMIPTDKEELLSHVISWTVLETHDIVSKYLHEWVAKRTKEYLGEEVESLTSFIVTQLKSRCQPKELLDELSTILEDDSEAFVLKLWRMLVYYSLKCEMEDKA